MPPARVSQVTTATDTWVVRDDQGGMTLYKLFAAREETLKDARQVALSVANLLCVTRRWSSCRSVTPASVSEVAKAATSADATLPPQVTFSPAGGGTVTLALVGNSHSPLYRTATADAGKESDLRQPPSTGVTATPTNPEDDTVEDTAPDNAGDDSSWEPAQSAASAQTAISTAMLRRYGKDAWPTLPSELVGQHRCLRFPAPAEATSDEFKDMVFSEVDGGTRIGSVKLANAGLVRAMASECAVDGASALGPGNLSSAPAIVIVAPLEAVVGVEAALRERDKHPTTWLPTARQLTEAMAPTLRSVGEDLNVRARGTVPESSGAEVLRMIQTWTECVLVADLSAERARAPTLFQVPRQWAKTGAVPGAPNAFRDGSTQAFTIHPPLSDCMPALKLAAAATLGKPANTAWAMVYVVCRRGLLGGFVPGGCDEESYDAPVRADGRPGFPHRCSLCVSEREMLERRWLPTVGIELFLRAPRLKAAPANGHITAASRRAINRCHGLGLPFASLGRWRGAAQRAHSAFLGVAGVVLYGQGAEPSKAATFSERRWAWRAEIHADRLRFGALSLRLAVYAMERSNYDVLQVHQAASDLASVLHMLQLPDQAGATPGRVPPAENVAIVMGITQALLIYEVTACVGLIDPMLLVPRICARRQYALDDARRASTDDFVARYVRVFFDEEFLSDSGSGERRDDRVPLLLSIGAVGPAVTKAVQDALRCDAGPAVLQASLPALADIVRDITEGEYDVVAWRNAVRRRDGINATETRSNEVSDIPAACLRAMSGLRSQDDSEDSAAGHLRLAHHVAQALGAGWMHQLDALLERQDLAVESGAAEEEAGRWRAVASGDALACENKEARQRWSLLTARCGVRGWALACGSNGDSPIAASAVLGVHQPPPGGDPGSVGLFANSVDYFSSSVDVVRITAIAVQTTRLETEMQKKWLDAEAKASRAAAAAKKDGEKALQRTSAAKARAAKVDIEIQGRIAAAETARKEAEKRGEAACTDRDQAWVDHELEKRNVEHLAWKNALNASPGALLSWLDGRVVGNDHSTGVSSSAVQLPLLSPTPEIPDGGGGSCGSNEGSHNGEQRCNSANSALVPLDSESDAQNSYALDGEPVAVTGAQTAHEAAAAHVRHVNSLVSASTRKLGEIYLAAVAKEASSLRRRRGDDTGNDTVALKKPRWD